MDVFRALEIMALRSTALQLFNALTVNFPLSVSVPFSAPNLNSKKQCPLLFYLRATSYPLHFS